MNVEHISLINFTATGISSFAAGWLIVDNFRLRKRLKEQQEVTRWESSKTLNVLIAMVRWSREIVNMVNSGAVKPIQGVKELETLMEILKMIDSEDEQLKIQIGMKILDRIYLKNRTV